jgi:hypothetical protein
MFLHEAGEALDSHDQETRRMLDWLLADQPARWQQEVRRGDDELTRAKIELERCRSSRLPGGEPPSCMEERKAVDRARLRRAYAEQKVEAVQKWGRLFDREVTEYSARANQLRSLVDVDLVGAMAMLDRVLTSLEAYAALRSEIDRPAEPGPVVLARPDRAGQRPPAGQPEGDAETARGSEASALQPADAPPPNADPGPRPTEPKNQ